MTLSRTVPAGAATEQQRLPEHALFIYNSLLIYTLLLISSLALLPFLSEHSQCQWPGSGVPCGAEFPAGSTGDAQHVLMDSGLTLGSSWQGRSGCCCLCCDRVKCCFSKPAPSVYTCLDIIQSSAVFAGHCFKTNRD